MYLEYFQLKELPFRLSPDPAFLYLSQIHSHAMKHENTLNIRDCFQLLFILFAVVFLLLIGIY